MTTAAELIVSARYDLRDSDKTQYSDPMLLDYLNRGLRPLCAALASLRSDWVNSSTSLTLASGDDDTDLPSDFISVINIKIGTNDLTKKSISWIRDYLVSSSAGLPSYYAIQGTSILVEKEADDDYTLLFEYNATTATLVSTDNMPYNNEFNDVLRQFLTLIGKSRNEYSIISDAAMQDFFYAAVFSKLVSRNHVANVHRTTF